MNNLVYCGFHYKNTPLEVREIFAKTLAQTSAAQLKKLFCSYNAAEHLDYVLLNTCNRFELCFLGHFTLAQLRDIFFLLSEGTVSQEQLKKCLRFFTGHEALKMLFNVSASLDSLVLGETQISGQLKDAFQDAVRNNHCGPKLQKIFAACFQASKRIRHETALGKNSISIAHAAVDMTRRIFESPQNSKSLIIGAGEMGKLILQYLKSKGSNQIFLANRNYAKAIAIEKELENSCKAISIEKSIQILHEFDIIFVATASSDYVLRYEHLENYRSKRDGEVGLLIDISVPRNIDPKIKNLDDVFLFDVDDLVKVTEENRQLRMAEAKIAQNIIAEEIEKFLDQQHQRLHLNTIGLFHSWIYKTVEMEVKKSKQNRSIDQFDSAQIIATAVSKKLVAPVAHMIRNKNSFFKDETELEQAKKYFEKLLQLNKKEHT